MPAQIFILDVAPASGNTNKHFRQVHLEIDPTEYEDDEDKFAALKESNNARLEILRHILAERLEMDCQNANGEPQMTPGFFLGRHDVSKNISRSVQSR